jgi:hypothetical protein
VEQQSEALEAAHARAQGLLAAEEVEQHLGSEPKQNDKARGPREEEAPIEEERV